MASLSGPDSRRRLGTQSGAMRREARKLERNGNERAAGALQVGAAEQKLQEGSAITSSEQTISDRRTMRTIERGQMQQQRDSVLKPEAGDATAPAAGGAARPTLSRPNASYDSDNNGIPNSLQRPASSLQGPPAPVREGRINGMPASQANAEVEKPTGFGKEYATQNIEKLGLAGAIADYHRRSAEGAKPAEPGNMAEVNAARFVGPKQSPLTGAMNEALARNAERGTDAIAAKGITAGLNAAPTPKLNTSFPTSRFNSTMLERQKAREDGAAMLAKKNSVSPTPAPAQIKSSPTTPNIGEDGFVSLGAPFSDARKKFRAEEAKGFKAPLRSATLALGAGLSRFGRDVRKSYQ